MRERAREEERERGTEGWRMDLEGDEEGALEPPGFWVWVLGFGFWFWDWGFGVWGLGMRVQG